MGIVILILFIFLIYNFVGLPKNFNQANNEEPMDILKKRYARGEIGREEYLSLKDILI
jgi:uncharacterized membrane protein